MMDRSRIDELPTLQVQFIDSICLPLYQVSLQILKLTESEIRELWTTPKLSAVIREFGTCCHQGGWDTLSHPPCCHHPPPFLSNDSDDSKFGKRDRMPDGACVCEVWSVMKFNNSYAWFFSAESCKGVVRIESVVRRMLRQSQKLDEQI